MNKKNALSLFLLTFFGEQTPHGEKKLFPNGESTKGNAQMCYVQ